MERERIDEGPARVPDLVPEQARDKAGPADLHLPTSIGNAAFTRVVRGAATPQAQRASRTAQGAGPLDPGIAEDIEHARGGGSPLPDDAHAEMRAGLGVDFSNVRIHTDARADALSRSVQAEAFTTGTDVFFRSGAYTPGSTGGRRLLAHELTHVVQQGTGQVEGGRVSHPDDAHEVEARSVGEAVAASPVTSAPAVARADAGPDDDPVQASISRQEVPDEPEEEVAEAP